MPAGRPFYTSDSPDVLIFAREYKVDHPMFNACTLYEKDGRGLIVVQAYFNEINKYIFWGPVEAHIANDIYLSPKFENVFNELSGECKNGIYPIIKLRPLMWKLRMNPIKKKYFERW